MSYDLTLFRPPAGVDPLEAWHRIEREEEGWFPGTADPGEVADLLKARVPEFGPTLLKDGSIELGHDTLVQVFITVREVFINMPVMRKEAIAAREAVVGACLDCLAEAGFVAFDPQLDLIVTAADYGVTTAHYRDRQPVRKPWWKFW